MTERDLQYDGYQWNLNPGFPGPRGPVGLVGPQGPPGPNTITGIAAGGDLSGTYPDPVVNQSSHASFNVLGQQINFEGGTDGTAYTQIATDTTRTGLVTTDATPTTLSLVSITSGAMTRMLVEVVAIREDVMGDAAWFLLKGVWFNNGGTVNQVVAPTVIDTGNTGSASAWAAVIVQSGLGLSVQVTGEAGKTIHWAIVYEDVGAL